MKISHTLIVILSGLLPSLAHADAIELQELRRLMEAIANESKKASELGIYTDQEIVQPPQLWLHIRRDDQKPLAEQVLQRLKGASLDGKSIQLEPIQKVDTGPKRNQLRFFKEGDEQEAKELFHLISKSVPELMLVDLSKEYASVSWLKPGHFELWLSPEMSKVLPSE